MQSFFLLNKPMQFLLVNFICTSSNNTGLIFGRFFGNSTQLELAVFEFFGFWLDFFLCLHFHFLQISANVQFIWVWACTTVPIPCFYKRRDKNNSPSKNCHSRSLSYPHLWIQIAVNIPKIYFSTQKLTPFSWKL